MSCKKAVVLPVAKASAHNDIIADPTKKYQKLPPMTYMMLDRRRHILLIKIALLFPILSQRIPAGTWKMSAIAYPTAV